MSEDAWVCIALIAAATIIAVAAILKGWEI